MDRSRKLLALSIYGGLFSILAGVLIYRFQCRPPFRERKAASPSQAIGNTLDLKPSLRCEFDPLNDFRPMPTPQKGDWLAEHKEPGQTFDEFVRGTYLKPTSSRRNLVLQPMNMPPSPATPDQSALAEYMEAMFQLPAKIASPLNPDKFGIPSRHRPDLGRRQLLAGAITALLKMRLAPTTFLAAAITMEDLYPSPNWNFVFGQASLRDRVSVLSFARYDPSFYGEKRPKNFQEMLLRRSINVLGHETGHMFGMRHCIYFHCLMNGSNHLEESDRQPLHLCPVCLRKLHHALQFDPIKRYRDLERVYRLWGLTKEATWIQNRIRNLNRCSPKKRS